MSGGCTDTGPWDGGTWNNLHLKTPEITEGTLSNTELKTSVTMDEAVAKDIYDAIHEVEPTPLAEQPGTNTGTDLPTEIVGDARTQVLGKPAAWLKFGSYMVPAYKV